MEADAEQQLTATLANLSLQRAALSERASPSRDRHQLRCVTPAPLSARLLPHSAPPKIRTAMAASSAVRRGVQETL
jgi:hypothetical protein